jgi:hypothetical protein
MLNKRNRFFRSLWLTNLLLFVIISDQFANAATPGWAFEGGLFQHNMMKLTDTPAGTEDKFGDAYYPLGVKYTIDMGGYFFAPAFHFTNITSLVKPNETPEEGAQKEIWLLHFPAVMNVTAWLDLKFGLGIFRYEIKGKGGTIELNNGTGTATAYKPDRTVTSNTMYLVLGSGFPMTGWDLNLDLIIPGAMDEDRRTYNLYLYGSLPF